MKICLMQISDIAQIVKLETQVQFHPWNERQFIDSLNNYQCTVMKQSDIVIGFCIMQPVLDEANLLLMAIDPRYQGQGLGYQLLQDAISRLGEKYVQIFLEVRESNLSAIALYEKIGFHQIDIRKNYYPSHDGKKEHAIIMVKMIDDTIFNFKLD